LIEWFFESEYALGGMSGAGCRNFLEGVGLSRDEKIVRETLQNSADALALGAQRSKVVFRLVSLVGESKVAFLDESKLHQVLGTRSEELGLPAHFSSNDFFGESPLELLYIEDFMTTGLRGEEHSRGQFSDFFRFIYLYGDEEKATSGDLSLGSYGLGKSVLSSASSVFAFFVNTVANPDECSGVFARTIGCGLYKSHTFENQNFSGRTWFGDTSGSGMVSALQNEEALDFAVSLGFTARSKEQTGTSICIIGLPASAEHYVEAVSKYWWPRIIKQELTVEVIDQHGQKHIPKPKQNPKLKKYIEAFELANGIDQSKDDDSKRIDFRKSAGLPTLGVLAAKRGLPLESNEIPDALDNKVALLRQKGMVVDYYQVPTSSNQRWYAVFLADSESDDYLKLSEPAAHNKWDSGSNRLFHKYGVGGKKVVDTILQRIHSNIRGWFSASRATQQQADQRVRRLDELFGSLFRSPGPTPPPPEQNPAPVHLDHLDGHYVESGQNAWITANPVLRLKDDYPSESLVVNVKPACRICEDIELKLGDFLQVSATSDGSSLISSGDGIYELVLSKHQPVCITLKSEEFDNRLMVDWRIEVTPK
jgi:hypothetical protein